MGRANVDIDQATHEVLKNVKEQLGLKKLGDVMRVLADHYLGRSPAPGSDDEEGEDAGEPEKSRKINVREPLYSFEVLAKRRGMLEYYTGFDRPAIDLLIRRVGEVRTTCHVSRSAWTHSRPRVPVLSFDVLPSGRRSRGTRSTREQ